MSLVPRNGWLPLLLLSAVGFAGCSGGDIAGIEGTGSPIDSIASSEGSVTAVGSIFVNGERIDTGSADIRVNGSLAGEEELGLGMVVQVELDTQDGERAALNVTHRRALRGQVSEVLDSREERKVLSLMGQVVVVYDDSVFSGVSFEALEGGSWVDISGFADAEDRLVVTRLAQAEPGVAPEVIGRLQNLDRTQARFMLGDLEVDYSDSIFENGTRDELAAGVQLRLLGGDFAGDSFSPERIRLEPAREPEAGVELSREGIIRTFSSVSHWQLGDLTVDASGAQISGDESSLAQGVRVSVSGTVDAEGVLQAEQLRLLPAGRNRVRAQVEAVDVEAGSLDILGQTYFITELTVFENRRSSNSERFNSLEQVRRDDWVELHSFELGEEQRLRRIKLLGNQEREILIRGPVSAINQAEGTVQLLGAQVFFQGTDGEELLAQLQAGDRLSIRGALQGPQIILAGGFTLEPPVEEPPGCVMPQSGCPEQGMGGVPGN